MELLFRGNRHIGGAIERRKMGSEKGRVHELKDAQERKKSQTTLTEFTSLLQTGGQSLRVSNLLP